MRDRPSQLDQQEVQVLVPGRRVLAEEAPRRLQLPSEQHDVEDPVAIFVQKTPESPDICLGVRHVPSRIRLPSRAYHAALSRHNEKGRIGNPEVDGQGLVARPTLLRIPGAHIVALIAGGW